MKYFLFIFFWQVMALPSFGQLVDNSIQLSGGIGQFTSYDQLINDYSYSGNSLQIIQLQGQIQRNSNQLQFQVLAYNGFGKPIDFNPILYEYNEGQFQTFQLQLIYLKAIPLNPAKFNLALGAGYRMAFCEQKQQYKNVLYNFVEGHQRSYCNNWGSLSGHLQLQYILNSKNNIQLASQYAFLSFVSRPDSDYVKQLTNDRTGQTKHFLDKEYRAYQLGLTYTHFLTTSLGISLEAKTNFEYYQIQDAYANRINSLLLGVIKHF